MHVITREQFYGGKDPRDTPTYLVSEAAGHLHLPDSTVRSWIAGTAYQTKAGRKRSAPLIEAADTKPWMLSFWNLIELKVLASMRRKHEIAMKKIRVALDFVENELGIQRPLVKREFVTDGIDLFVDHLGHLVNASQHSRQLVFKELVASLIRIERDEEGVAESFYPWDTDPAREPLIVRINPLTAFGRPVLRGTRITTESIADRFRGGDSPEEIAEEFGVDPRKVRTAIRWELGDEAA